ncbi:unnamed protein product, partial [Prorocentrum cordatum]
AASFAARQQHRDPGGARRLRPGARWAPRPRRPRRRRGVRRTCARAARGRPGDEEQWVVQGLAARTRWTPTARCTRKERDGLRAPHGAHGGEAAHGPEDYDAPAPGPDARSSGRSGAAEQLLGPRSRRRKQSKEVRRAERTREPALHRVPVGRGARPASQAGTRGAPGPREGRPPRFLTTDGDGPGATSSYKLPVVMSHDGGEAGDKLEERGS